MEKMIKNKKGDGLSSTWVVTIIILLISFGVLLLFLYNFYWSQSLDTQTCYESVVLRSTLPKIVDSYIPLKCKTADICITTGIFGGSCKQFNGVKGVVTMRVSSDPVKAKTQIERIYAQQMVECWNMMGSGKVSVFSQYLADQFGFIGKTYSSCVICSKIALDYDRLNSIKLDPSKIDVLTYMVTHQVPGKSVSYYEYFGGKATLGGVLEKSESININPDNPFSIDLSLIDKQDQTSLSETKQFYEEVSKSSDKGLSNPESKFDFSKDSDAILFMQISAPGHWESFANVGTSALALLGVSAYLKPGAFIGNPFSFQGTGATRTIGFSAIQNSASSGGIKFTASKILTKFTVSLIAIYAVLNVVDQASVYDKRTLAAGYCSDISTGSDARSGCSAVRLVAYNESDVKSYCSKIESIQD